MLSFIQKEKKIINCILYSILLHVQCHIKVELLKITEEVKFIFYIYIKIVSLTYLFISSGTHQLLMLMRLWLSYPCTKDLQRPATSKWGRSSPLLTAPITWTLCPPSWALPRNGRLWRRTTTPQNVQSAKRPPENTVIMVSFYFAVGKTVLFKQHVSEKDR